MDATLDLAKVTSKGQVTMRNASVDAMKKLQAAFEGAAEEAGLTSEGDINTLVRQMRAEKGASL